MTRRSGHAGFGLGLHRCLGVHFARVRIAMVFEELFKRITNLRFADPNAEIRWVPGIANDPTALDLAFDVIA